MAFITPPSLEQLQPVDLNKSAIITVRDLNKQFGSEVAVDNVTFSIPDSTIFGFIGPSGSGKTTTVRVLTGIYRPTSGEVFVLGSPPVKFSKKQRANIGYMPQLFVLYPHLTVWENLNFAASLYGMGFFRGKKLNRILDFVELSEHKHKLVRDTSGGMQRRLSLAATLLHNPTLLFLDEPTTGIDPVLRRKFWDHFKQLQNEGRTLFITTQYVSEAAYCDLVGVMANGKLITVDTPVGLRRQAYKGDVIDLHTTAPIDYRIEQQLRTLPLVSGNITRMAPNLLRIVVKDARTAIPDLIEWAKAQNLDVDAVEEYLPPYDDVFVELVKNEEALNV